MAFCLLWICHVLYFIIALPSNRPKALKQTLLIFLPFVGAGSVYLITSNLNVGSVTEPTGIAVIGVALMAMVFFVSIMFYMGVDHSIRVRMFVEFYRNGKQPIVAQNLISRYLKSNPVQNRLNQLIHGGYLVDKGNGQFKLTAKGEKMAKIATKGKQFFKIGVGG